MKTCFVSLRPCGLVLLALFTAPWLSAGGVLDFLVGSYDLQTITVTDFTPAGSLLRLPTLEHPVYYAAVSAGYCDLGGIKAGERPVARPLVDRTMVRILAKQGYLPAAPGQRPDVILAWRWGSLNVDVLKDGSGFNFRRSNEQQILRFLGGEKLGLLSRNGEAFPEQTLPTGLFILSGRARDLMDTAREDLYVAVISAYAVNLPDPQHAQLLWNTRISAPARGFWLPEALPAMLAIAGPYVGRETNAPVWIRASEKFKPEIHLGDARVVEYLEKTPVTVAQVGPSS